MTVQKLQPTTDSGVSPTQCVRAKTLAQMLDISERTLRRKVAMGEFPQPIRLGKGTTRWRLRDVESWLSKSPGR